MVFPPLNWQAKHIAKRLKSITDIKSLSWSELSLFESDFDAWYSKYIAGIEEKPSPAMLKGTLIHNMLQTGKQPSEGQSEGDRRILKAILESFEALLAPDRSEIEWEKLNTAILDGIPTIGYWDGYWENSIIEIKTGSTLWTQEKAENHGQLAFYALQHGDNPDFLLFSANTKNGKCKSFRIKHTKKQLEDMKQRMNKVWEAMSPYHELRTKKLVSI